MTFSQRIGKTPASKLVQREAIDGDLRNSLWSAISLIYWQTVQYKAVKSGYTKHSTRANLIQSLWLNYYKKPVDEIPTRFSDAVKTMRLWFFAAEWYKILDFVECCENFGGTNNKKDFVNLCNQCFERENSAYRFVNGQLTELTSQEEINAVEQAINVGDRFSGTREHLNSALHLMNDKVNPDYRNSIKESISAVESLAKILSGNDKASLSDALATLEKNEKLHPALKKAFTSLYGYTSDANGIRHALLEESSLQKADAKFMLVSCSCFVNYLIEISNP